MNDKKHRTQPQAIREAWRAKAVERIMEHTFLADNECCTCGAILSTSWNSFATHLAEELYPA